jgi:hypothetical protein
MLSDTSDEEFNLFTDQVIDDFNTDGQSKFSVEYLKQQFFRIPYSTFLNGDPQLPLLDTIEKDAVPPSSTEVAGSSTFSSFQMKGFIILSCVVVMSFLILIKLYIGIRIRLYAIKRVETLNKRLVEDQDHGRDRRPIGLSAKEMMKEEDERKLIDQPEFDLPQRPPLPSPPFNPSSKPAALDHPSPEASPDRLLKKNTSSHPPPETPSPSQDRASSSSSHHKKKILSMDELSRFDMVRSRIW